ncbi:MAG: leucine-rich repeat domain-containing protein [Caldilineaceae bacterium]
MRFPQADLNPLRGEYTGVGRWMDVANPDRVEVVEWSAFVDLDGRLVFAGAVENVGEEQFSLVDVVVRFYAEDGALVEVVNGAVSGRWVKPERMAVSGGYVFVGGCWVWPAGRLLSLELLDVSYNELTALPAEVGDLVNLKTLNLSDNQLTSLPPEIGELSSLGYLSVEQNSFDLAST